MGAGIGIAADPVLRGEKRLEVDFRSGVKDVDGGAEIAMKERCLQIANTVATSNMGDIYFEAFYSTYVRLAWLPNVLSNSYKNALLLKG